MVGNMSVKRQAKVQAKERLNDEAMSQDKNKVICYSFIITFYSFK